MTGEFSEDSVAVSEEKSVVTAGERHGFSGPLNGVSLIDHLSELFVSISDLCQEQFSIIRQVSLQE